MKKSNAFLLLCFAFLAFSCGNNTASSDSEGDATADSTENTAATSDASSEDTAEAKPSVPMSGESYSINVIDAEPKSPRKEMNAKIGTVDIAINYGSPSKRGREIWGTSLVPYGGKVWRTGANEATTIKFSHDVMIEGKKLPAGSYSLFTVNEENSATIHFNSELGQWGTNHDASKDVLVVQVSPEQKELDAESMDFIADGDAIVLRWGKRAIPFKISAA